MTGKYDKNLILAIYPNSSGFGYVCMASGRKLLDCRSVVLSPICNRKVMRKIRNYVEYFKPTVILLQNPEGKYSRSGLRVKRLLLRIKVFAKEQNLKVYTYSRDQIRSVFKQFGKKSKYEIAHHLVTEFQELKHRAPKVRKVWNAEDYYMPIFDALSLAVTHYFHSDD